MRIPRLVAFVLAGIAGGVAIWLALPWAALSIAEHDINHLYGQYRPLAYRWQGAPYGPLTGRRRVPAERIAATAKWIQFAENRGGRSARSIRLTGRLEALSGNLDRALSSLRLAHLLDPNDAWTLSELGAVRALRAEEEQRAADFAPALDEVARALAMAPESAVAAFNAALVFEAFPLPGQAARLWARAVSREDGRDWRSEAERRLAAAAKVVEERTAASAQLMAEPSTLAVSQRGGGAELMLAVALEKWLPDRQQWKLPLTILADYLEQQHSDPWLKDLLDLHESAAAAQAMQDLSSAWRANANGDYERAEKLAANAEGEFHAIGSPAGEARARLEHVAALHRQGRSEECLSTLEGAMEAAQKRSYRWIYGQAWLDRVTCLGQLRRIDVVEQRENAYRWIEATGYQGITLRAVTFLIEEQVGLSNPLRVWARGRRGVSEYWTGVLPLIRVHPLYYALSQSAYSWGRPFAAAALAQESVLALEQTGNRPLLAFVLSRLGYYQASAGLRGEAESSYARAAELFSALDSRQSGLMRGLAEIEAAKGETWAGRPAAAIARLRRLPAIEYGGYGDLFVRPALGSALLAANQLPEATREFEQAIQESERQLKTLSNAVQRESADREIAVAYRGLTQAQMLAGQPARALENWRRFRMGAQSRVVPPQELPPGTAVLTAAYLPRGLAFWFSDAHGLMTASADGAGVEFAAGRLADLAADPKVPEALVLEAADALSRLILDPFRKRLASITTLLIDADGTLAKTPWGLLSTNGKRLIEQMATVQIQGSAACKCSTVRYRRALILADADLGPELRESYPVLVDARREAEEIHRRLPESLLLTGLEVNLGAFGQLSQDRHVLHFAGHGISNGGFGALLMASRIGGLGGGQVVSSEELAHIDLSGLDLVFLAACSTGADESFGTANPDSLVRAMLQAGAARVVATRWNVASHPTRDVVESFYDLLADGNPLTPAEALRRAMLSVARQPGVRHPYYWAGFQIFGTP